MRTALLEGCLVVTLVGLVSASSWGCNCMGHVCEALDGFWNPSGNPDYPGICTGVVGQIVTCSIPPM